MAAHRLGVRAASSTASSAASRYFSSSNGGTASTSPSVSKPAPRSSAGKSSAGRKAMPSNARRVLLYSTRLSRRRATRASGCGVAQAPWNAASAHQDSKVAVSAALGRGLSVGGMRPARTTWATRRQQLGSRSAAAAVRSARLTPPRGDSALWQRTQYRSRSGAMVCSNVAARANGSGGATATSVSSGSSRAGGGADGRLAQSASPSPTPQVSTKRTTPLRLRMRSTP
jgi:hypothetical protein